MVSDAQRLANRIKMGATPDYDRKLLMNIEKNRD
jgi:hypothetical protein